MQQRPQDGPPEEWPTGVTLIGEGLIAPRGYPIQELMGRVGFAQVVALLFLGELPDQRTAALIDAILVSSVDHGTTSPSALTARTVASSGTDVGHAAAAGLLAIGRYHGGALAPCMEVLKEVVAIHHDEGLPLDESAGRVVRGWRQRGERVPGFGHRVHTTDPRVGRLFEIGSELGFATVYPDAARAVEKALAKELGRPVPMNLDGAIAAMLCTIDLPVSLANPLFMLARFLGLLAQAHEERTRMRPMRKMRADLFRYDGPPLRHLAAREP